MRKLEDLDCSFDILESFCIPSADKSRRPLNLALTRQATRESCGRRMDEKDGVLKSHASRPCWCGNPALLRADEGDELTLGLGYNF